MTIDIHEHISAVRRQVGTRTLEVGQARVVTLTRTYGAPVDDVWDACTSVERIPRWFLPITGDLRVGGRYQLQGNAGGVVERCDPPRRLVLDIPEGDGPPWRVAVSLTEEGGRTVLLFEQRVVGGVSPADVEAGWSWYLDRLGASLHDAPMPQWPDYAPAR